MPAKRAVEAFRSRQFNCAQSVLCAFRQEHGVSDERMAEARGHGGGRAEGGRCGALHAALQLTGDAAARDALRKGFTAKAGSEQCREIRKAKTLTCEQCVQLAATLLAERPAPTPGSPA